MRRGRVGRAAASRGQVLVIFAAAATAIMGATGLVVDGINLYSAQRAAQGAADLAALAGALDLPGDANGAEDEAIRNAGQNGYRPDAMTTVTATAPFASDSRRIEVVIDRQVSTYFLPILGVRSVAVRTRAVAVNPPRVYALFAGYNACSDFPGGSLGANVEEAIHWSGSTATVTGDAHSNAGMKFSGSDNTIDGHVTYKCNRKFVDSGSGNVIADGPDRVDALPYPVVYDAVSFGCTFVVDDGTDIGSDEGPWWESPGKSSNRLKPGVYCVLGKLSLSGSDIAGNVTLIAFGDAGQISLSGSNLRLTPFAQGVLAFSQGTGPDAIYMSGSAGRWDGTLYAPVGRANISGSSNLAVRGAIIADTIKLSGSDWSLSNTDAGGQGPHLVE